MYHIHNPSQYMRNASVKDAFDTFFFLRPTGSNMHYCFLAIPNKNNLSQFYSLNQMEEKITASFSIIILCQDHLTHPISTTGALSSTTAVPSGESQACFSPVLLLPLSPLAFLFPFLQTHMTTPFKNVK